MKGKSSSANFFVLENDPMVANSSVEVVDILVLYENVAKSASDSCYEEMMPYSKSTSYYDYNFPYAYLLQECEKKGMKACFATITDVTGPGQVSSFWTYEHNQWKRNNRNAFSKFIFLRCPPEGKTNITSLELLFSNSSIISFSDLSLSYLFLNKLKTYQAFPEFAIPTVELGIFTKNNFEEARKRLSEIVVNHPHGEDFEGDLVIKDNYGSSGINVVKVSQNMKFSEIEKKICSENEIDKEVWYVLQPHIQCDKGFVIGEYSGTIDLRLWMIDDFLLQTSLRIAKVGEFRANLHQGGSEFFIPQSLIPQEVLSAASGIRKKLECGPSFYGLDFIRSNNGNLYFIEGNSSPGIDWVTGNSAHEARQKRAIQKLVDEFLGLIAPAKISHPHISSKS